MTLVLSFARSLMEKLQHSWYLLYPTNDDQQSRIIAIREKITPEKTKGQHGVLSF